MSNDLHSKVDVDIERLGSLTTEALRARWRSEFGRVCPPHLSKPMLMRILAHQVQVRAYGDLTKESRRLLDGLAKEHASGKTSNTSIPLPGSNKPTKGTILVREHDGHLHHVTVVEDGFIWNGNTYPNLSKVAFAITGTKWNGPRFFGLRSRRKDHDKE